MSNPPYHRRGTATPPAHGHRRRGAPRRERRSRAWIGACLARLRPPGRLTLIHRADALAELLAALAGRAGDVVVFPLWPERRSTCRQARDRRGPQGWARPSRLARGLVLHEPDGRYTDAADAILRDGAPITL